MPLASACAAAASVSGSRHGWQPPAGPGCPSRRRCPLPLIFVRTRGCPIAEFLPQSVPPEVEGLHNMGVRRNDPVKVPCRCHGSSFPATAWAEGPLASACPALPCQTDTLHRLRQATSLTPPRISQPFFRSHYTSTSRRCQHPLPPPVNLRMRAGVAFRGHSPSNGQTICPSRFGHWLDQLPGARDLRCAVCIPHRQGTTNVAACSL